MAASPKIDLLKQIWNALPEDGSCVCGYCRDKFMTVADFLKIHCKFSRIEQLREDLDYIKTVTNQ